MRTLYSGGDSARVAVEAAQKDPEPHRLPWRRDYARLIHCPAFRRLQGKTQVFPCYESDFYRNRLTHSLEVAQIAKSIAIRLNATARVFKRKSAKIEPDIVEFAGLAHDLGHPPFGHNGEEALDECMRNHGGYEGNAQSLRIVARLEKKVTHACPEGDFVAFDAGRKDLRCGLNLTYRSLAALLKYDRMIPERYEDREKAEDKKGYYAEDASLVASIKEHVLGTNDFTGKFKTIECSIMDIADDIAYSTYDLEDNFKAGFLTPMALFALEPEIYDAVAKKIAQRGEDQYPEEDISQIDADLVQRALFFVFKDMLFRVDEEVRNIIKSRNADWSVKKMLVAAEVQALSRKLAGDGYHRVKFTSSLVQNFLSDIEVVPHMTYPQLHQIRLKFNTFLFVEVLKNLTYYAIIRSPRLQVAEHRGKDIIKQIFEALDTDDGTGTRLLPEDFRAICKGATVMVRKRAICDFIAGMTDRYAIEFYSRLYGVNDLTIHKPF